MLRKVLTALIVSSLLWLAPAAGQPEAYRYPQLWLLVVFGILAGIFQPPYKPMDRQAPSQDRGTATQLVWTVYLTQLLGVVEAVYFRFPDGFRWDWAAVLFLDLAVLGLLLRSWAFRELGEFFTWHVNVKSGHRVVRSGPYRWIRHPSYTGAFLMYTSTNFFLHAWVVGGLTVALLLIAFLRRIHHEEGWMRQHLGEEYARYAQQTKALIPYLL
jgi:protein-S-isoprenylcysteine O-methyltransferase